MKPLKRAEEQLREKLESLGWEVVHKGWPDFACVRDNEMMFVEVESYKGEMLKKQQHYLLTNLAKLGLNCYKWTPNGGFELITPSMPIPEKAERETGRRLTLEEKWARLSPEQQEQIRSDEASGKQRYI